MKKIIFINIVYILLFVVGSTYGLGENTVQLGGRSGWKIAEFRSGIAEVMSVRPNPVLVLSSATGHNPASYTAAAGVSGNFISLDKAAADMSISFDEGDIYRFYDSAGNYQLTVSPELTAVNRLYARAGTGAALFSGIGTGSAGSPLVIKAERRNALFSTENHIGDFSIEFWLHPFNLENGEQIFSWMATKKMKTEYDLQDIRCTVLKNRLQWSFRNFFISPDDNNSIDFTFSGVTPVIPKNWSHHLIRFDANTGLLEYLVDGKSEVIVYATPNGHEGGEVFHPVVGKGGAFVIGEQFMGLIDELKIHSACIGRTSLQKYLPAGGRIETSAIDLEQSESRVLMIVASGGITSIRGTKISSEYKENGRFIFPNDSEMQFFIRSSNNPYRLNENNWIKFTPGIIFPDALTGRYVQIAVDFYPSADGETTPYLEEMRIVYLPGEPPLPPLNVTAVAVDGGVQLRWKYSPDASTDGYLVYYSSVRGELFGTEADLGASPIDAGNSNSLTIKGLKNGSLYYFRVASYSYSSALNYYAGEFSKEVTARPLVGLSLQLPEDVFR
jgi:hypothetical protein